MINKIISIKTKKQKITMLLGWILIVVFTLTILAYFILLTSSTEYSLVTLEYNLWSIPRIIRRTVQIYILFLLLVLAFCLSADKKNVVLYLRKFRLNTNVISPDNKGGLGKKIRIVTLQDESFPSMSSTRKDKLFAYVITFIIFISAILIIYYLEIVSIPVVSEGNSHLIVVIAFIIGYIMWLCITLLIFILFYIIVHNKNKVIQITKTQDIKIASSKVASLNFFIKRLSLLGTRSTIVETQNYLWQETVSSLISECDVAIIDITQLTDNITWEIKKCLSNNIPIVLIYSAEIKTQLIAILNHLSLHLNVETLSNIPALEFPANDKSQLSDFRINLVKIITESYSFSRQHVSINAYHFRRLFIYLFLFLLAIVFATLLTLTVGFHIETLIHQQCYYFILNNT
ncbi:hypothetical protein VB776_21750 [Arcicella sp. DC2W]|uniref:Gustatory receptor n=1 Tax=Arcicella gelida TaxID=2984195 RepID=A0ABU5SAR4_9BACT|nr:hypothetical protein [Arcicella sp. DC2W]MEA5405580.1 hypothetical protein [Arcicella sp. DC2W]